MKKIKKLLSASLVLVMTATLLAGCGGGSNAGNSGNSGGVAHAAAGKGEKGRYVEEDYGYSFGVGEDEYASMRSIVQLPDGTIRVWLSGNTVKLMDSADGGKTWTESTMDMSAVKQLVNQSGDDSSYGYIENIGMDREGNMVFVHYNTVSSQEDTLYIADTTTTWYFLSKDGQLSELPVEIPGIPKTRHEEYDQSWEDDGEAGETGEISETEDDGIIIDEGGSDEGGYNDYNGIQTVKLIDANTMYVLDYNGQLYHINLSDGQIVGTINDSDYLNDIYVCGDKLLTYNWDKVFEYKASTGEKVAEHEALAKEWQNARSSVTVTAAPDNDNIIYYADNDGIFAYDFSTETSTMVVDGKMTSLISMDSNIGVLLAKVNGDFLLEFTDYSENEYTETMLNYSYDPEAPARPDKELTIYTLMDDYQIRNVAASFQKNHPDIYVNVESGMSGDDAITTSDAIRTLNTEIMAGEGPDILFMNYLPIDSYVEKGLLADISSLADPLISEDKLFENIANTYRQSDGKLYAMPATFAVPVIVGKQADLDRINSLSDLAAITSENPDVSSIGFYDMTSLATSMSLTNASAWFNEDNTLNEENLKAYITDIKTIVDTAQKTLSEDYKSYLEDYKQYFIENDYSYGLYYNDATSNALEIMSGSQSLSFGNISDVYGIQTLSSIARAGKDVVYKAMPGAISNVYVPSNIFAMNSKAKNTEAAEEFMQYMLSDKGQNAFGRYNGFPVNIDSFNKGFVDPRAGEEGYDPSQSYGGMSSFDENGNEISLEIYWPNESEINAFKDFVNTLDTPSYSDTTILGTILNNCNKAIWGDVSVDDAVAQIVKDLNIYLSE